LNSFEGVKEPSVELKTAGFDGVTVNVRFDVGVKAVSWRGLVKVVKE
jgi:hypothetical protein